MNPPRIDTSHIKSPRDPMTAEEREAVRLEIREGSERLAQFVAEHGDARDEWREMFGQSWDAPEHDAA